MLKAQHGILIIFCTFIIICFILVFFPPQPIMAKDISPNLKSSFTITVTPIEFNSPPAPSSFSTEQTLKDITGPNKKQINSSELSALKRELAKDGWKVVGRAFFSSGKWLLKFTRLSTSVAPVMVAPTLQEMCKTKTPPPNCPMEVN
jgi:hypothetical protein